MAPKLNLAGFSQEYLMDIPEIDEQHKSYFELLDTMTEVVDDFYTPMTEDEADGVIDILDRLREYALVHFHTEEGYMAEAKYPGLEAQRNEHNRFITDVIRMTGEIMNGTAMPAIKIRNFMHDWYRDHILTMDKPFSEYYRQRSV